MKSIFQSRTFWFNLLTGLTLFLALPELQQVLPETSLQWLLLTQAAINIVLRLLTTQAVSLSKKEPSA